MTRTTTAYDQRKDGWRYLETKEKPVKTVHVCDRCKPTNRKHVNHFEVSA